MVIFLSARVINQNLVGFSAGKWKRCSLCGAAAAAGCRAFFAAGGFARTRALAAGAGVGSEAGGVPASTYPLAIFSATSLSQAARAFLASASCLVWV
jgi:hypothetical protein